MIATETERMRMIDRYNEVGLPLEQISESKARPLRKCAYPKCEECDEYHAHYCTVPIVVSLQNWRILEDFMERTEKRLTDLENLVTDEILRSDKGVTIPPEVKLNFTWDDYLGEDQ